MILPYLLPGCFHLRQLHRTGFTFQPSIAKPAFNFAYLTSKYFFTRNILKVFHLPGFPAFSITKCT